MTTCVDLDGTNLQLGFHHRGQKKFQLDSYKLGQLNHCELFSHICQIIVTCRNTAYNMCRSYSAHITEDLDEYATILPDETQPSHLDDYLIQKDRLSSLKSIWPKLDTRSQNLLEAKYILGKLDSDIAKELDIKEASVRMALSRARKKAYELIKRDAGIDTY